MKYAKWAVTLLFVFVTGVFLSSLKTYMQSFWNGLTVWAYNVLPALFPFAVICSLSVKFFPVPKHSLCKKLFGVRADGIWIVSLLCGYPVGAKCIAESSFGSETSTTLCAFCSTASPVFVVATVGISLLKSTVATVVLLASHLLSAVANGMLFKKNSKEENNCSNLFRAKDVGDSVTSAVLSVLSVGGLIALFFMLTDIFKSFLPMPLCDSVVTDFVFGLLEMTNGIVNISRKCGLLCATVLDSFLLSFGGLCVFAQSMAFLATKSISAKKLLLMKLTQGSLAALLSFALGKLFLT